MPVMDAPIPADQEKITQTENAVRRLTGAYYTLPTAADFMAHWLMRQDGEHVLEPSFGDGVFLRSVAAISKNRNLDHIQITGIEIDETATARTQNNFPESSADLR